MKEVAVVVEVGRTGLYVSLLLFTMAPNVVGVDEVVGRQGSFVTNFPRRDSNSRCFSTFFSCSMIAILLFFTI